MTARELNTIFERQGIGHVRLEKPFDDSNEIQAFVVDDAGNYIESTDKWHFATIDINDSTGGFDTEDEITDEDYDWFEICDLQFHSQAWAYPRAYINECDGGIDVAEGNCGIRLTDYKMYENQESEIDLYTEQACKMFKDPLVYQNWLLKMFLEEQTKFIEKHYPMMKELGYWMAESDLYKRGFEHEYTSEIWLEFKTVTGMSNFYLKQNLFTGRWTFDDCEPNVNDKDRYKPNNNYVYNINDLSTEEFKEILLKRFKKNGEDFWREEREFRKKYNDEHGFDKACKEEHSTYSLDDFYMHKFGKTVKQLEEEVLSNIKN